MDGVEKEQQAGGGTSGRDAAKSVGSGSRRESGGSEGQAGGENGSGKAKSGAETQSSSTRTTSKASRRGAKKAKQKAAKASGSTEGVADERKSDCEGSDDSGSEEHAPIRLLDEATFEAAFEMIMEDTFHHYYVSRSWHPLWYRRLAYEGFISVSHGDLLLPEIQRSYCVLDFSNLHIGKRTRRLMRARPGLTLYSNRDWESCLQGLQKEWGDSNWLTRKYAVCLRASGLQTHSIELYDETDRLVAGEIGYSIGATYSLFVYVSGVRLHGCVSDF